MSQRYLQNLHTHNISQHSNLFIVQHAQQHIRNEIERTWETVMHTVSWRVRVRSEIEW